MVYDGKGELKSKYGRNNNAPKSDDAQQNVEKIKDSQDNITAENINIKLQQESAQNLMEQVIIQDEKRKQKIKKVKNETPLVIFLKIIVYIAIISIILSIIVAFMARTEVNTESESIIEQIKKAENLYFNATNRYCYFSKINYNDTLGVDLSKRKYFMSYEVIPNKEFGNYEVKLYGATNAFTITYYVIKGFILNKNK